MANRKANPKYLWSAARCRARKRCWEKGAKIDRGFPGQGGKTSRPGVACTGAKELEDILEVGKIAFYFVCLSSELLPFLLCARMSNSKAVDGK